VRRSANQYAPLEVQASWVFTGAWFPKNVFHYFMLFFLIDHLGSLWFHDTKSSALQGYHYNIMTGALRLSSSGQSPK
jgi:hypothetical protein